MEHPGQRKPRRAGVYVLVGWTEPSLASQKHRGWDTRSVRLLLQVWRRDQRDRFRLELAEQWDGRIC